MKEHILVTGGKGFLGSHLTNRLIELGHTIRVFSRKSGSNNVAADIVHGDIRDRSAVEQAVNGVDRVIHLISNFRKGGSDKNEAYAINVEGTENILQASIKFGVKQFIHCSTIGVHGDIKEIPADENSPFNPGDLYQETKLIAENRVWQMYKDTRLPITVIRPISMFGPGDLRMLKLFRMIKKGRFVIVGDGKPFFQPAYIDDVVKGFVLCLGNKRAIGEGFIVGGDEYVSLNNLFNLIAEELNVSPPKIRIPFLPVKILASLCETICVPFGIEPPIHLRRLSFFKNNRAFSINKAKTVLSFEPEVSLREGIKRTILWYTEHQWL